MPPAQREGAYALGATRFEAIRAALFYARTGIVGAVMLGFGRALGETMAVTMVIGNNPKVSLSLFAPQYTMAAVIANEFTEAADELYLHALVEIGLVLFIITLVINVAVAPADLDAWRGSRRRVVAEPVARRRRHDARRQRRKLLSSLFVGFCAGCRCCSRSCRSRFVLFFVVSQGIQSLNLDFFTHMPTPVGETGGGMANAIVGTLILIGARRRCSRCRSASSAASTCRSTPARRFAAAVRFAADTLNGVPSIVIGIFAYGVAVLPFKQFSALAGGFALGVMMIPIIARTTEELLLLVPGTMREGALALGATRARAVFTRRAAGGAAGHRHRRRAGAGAHRRRDRAAAVHRVQQPLLLDQPQAADLVADRAGLHLRDLGPYDDWHRQAWAGALVLVSIVLICSLLARFATRRLERMHARS